MIFISSNYVKWMDGNEDEILIQILYVRIIFFCLTYINISFIYIKHIIMDNHCDMAVKSIVGVITVVYLAFQIRNKRWSALVAFVVISALMCCGSMFSITPCTNVCVCLLLAIIGSNVVALPTTVSTTEFSETFANHDSGSNEKNKNENEADNEENEDSNKEDSVQGDDENEETNGESQQKKHSVKKKDEDDTDEDDKKEETVDTFSTFMETYRSLSPDQVESMTSDTKDLISTQKQLMQTVRSLAPVISQGKEMMDTFKDYFGPNGTNDLLKAFKNK